MSRDRTTAPRSAVLLLNWRAWEDTLECLESIFRQEYANLQVVVCDNDSGNGSLERVREWASGERSAPPPRTPELARLSTPPVPKPIAWVEYGPEGETLAEAGLGEPPRLVLIHTGGNLGFAGGNNVGLRYLLRQPEVEYVWLLNTDTVVDPAALAEMVRLAEAEPEVGMVGSKLMEYAEPDRIQAVAGGRVRAWQGLTRHLGAGERDHGQWDRSLEPDFITGASLLVRAETIRSIGEMAEEYFLYSEEVDWCLRARRQGWRLVYCPESVVWHKGGVSVGYKSAVHDYHTVRSSLLLVRKFYPAFLPAAILYTAYRSVAPKLVRLQFGRLRPVLRAYRDFLTGSLSGPG